MASRAPAAGIRHVVPIQEQPEAPPNLQRCSSTPWHVVFIFVSPVEIDIIQVHFQDSSPFETHPVNMWIFVFAILIFCIALGYSIKSRLTGSRCSNNTDDKIGYISGLMTSAAFISVLIPPSFEQFVFVISILVSSMFVDAIQNWILKVAQKLYHFAKDAVSYLHNIWSRIIGGNDNVAATIIPV